MPAPAFTAPWLRQLRTRYMPPERDSYRGALRRLQECQRVVAAR